MKNKYINMNILRDRVTILSLVSTKTAHGNTKNEYKDIEKVYASVEGYTSRIIENEVQRINETEYKIVMRYRKDIRKGFRFKYQNKILLVNKF